MTPESELQNDACVLKEIENFFAHIGVNKAGLPDAHFHSVLYLYDTMETATQDLKDKRNEPEYRNYITVGELLRIVREGLCYYAEEKAKELQAMLLKNYPGGNCNCLRLTHGVRPCRHTCKWGKVLEKLHKNKKKSRIPFHQSDFTQWHDPQNGFWEIAKIFMNDLGGNWQNIKDPATTDLTGLLNFLIFCKYCKVDENLLKSVRDLRNKLAHSTNLLLSELEKQAAFVDIENLLNDTELLSCQVLQDCRPVIEEIKISEVSIVQEKDVLRELIQLKQLENESHAEKRLKELKKMLALILSVISSNSSQQSYQPTKHNGSEHNTSSILFLASFLFFLVREAFVNCTRRRLFSICSPWLFLCVLLLPLVGDNSVNVADSGCSRTDEIPSAHKFGLSFDFHTHLSYKRENFSGRGWFFRELDDLFENISAPVGVLITGDPGSGKSALLSQLICSPLSSLAIHDNIIGYHLCDYSEKEKRNGASFVRNLVAQIASNIPEYADQISNKEHIRTALYSRCERDPTACFDTTIIVPLNRLYLESFKYIVIDALDECVEKDGETSAILDLLHYKIRYFPQWLKIIMSSRNGTIVHSKVPRTVRRVSLNSTDERNIEDIRFYISRFLKRKKSPFLGGLWKAFNPLNSDSTTYEITNELTKRAQGNFLYVKTVLHNNFETSGTVELESLPDSLDDMYYQVFQRYFLKEYFDRYEILFEILLAAGSLKETEVFGILKRGSQGTEMTDIVEHVSCLLKFGQDHSVSIYHQSFAEWLVNNHNRVRGFTIQKRRGHAYIADFLIDHTRRNNYRISFNELSRLCTHILNSEGPSDAHKEELKLLNITNLRSQQDGKSILHKLARKKSGFRLLEIFLPSFASIDILDFAGKTPAFYAASVGFVENIKAFLNKGTCANCVLNSVYLADEVKALMQMKGFEELSVMHVATFNGHTNVIDVLLQHNTSFLKFNEYVPSLLNVAAERGHVDLVKLLFNSGAKVDVISLHHAAARNNFFIVKYLLEIAGAKDECLECESIKVIHRNRSHLDDHGMFCETALHAAVSKGLFNVTKLLLQFGHSALECKHHSGKTPLMDAAERNDTKMVQLLLENGANVEEKCGEENSESFVEPRTSGVRSFHGKRFLYTIYREKTSCACGNKALHLCAKYGLWHMAKYLINHWNASVVDKNCKGETVWKIANVSHNDDFIYHVNRMLLNLDDKAVSVEQSDFEKNERRKLEKLLRKFFMRTKPYQSSFQCDSTFEGMSPLHIAALMGVRMLKRVYRRAHEIAPSLPLNCTNKHWIVPEYLAYFYDSIHALPDQSRQKQSGDRNADFTKPMLQYPDREAEFHLIYNYFYYSPSENLNVRTYHSLARLEDYDFSNCPGFYDLLPESNVLRVKPYCEQIGKKCEDKEKYEKNSEASALQNVKYCKNEGITFCICVHEIEQRWAFEQYARDCFCPLVMRELQMWFTALPKHNRPMNQFIAERMGWKNFGNNAVEQWPVYFLYKKLKNEYNSYQYLEDLNKGFQIDDEKDYKA